MKKDIKIVFDENDVTTPGFNTKVTLVATGIENLLQKISKLLLTRIGSDVFSPDNGTNIQMLLSSDPSNLPEITSLVNLSIAQAEDTILKDQADKKLEDEERLIGLELINISSIGQSDWFVEVYVKNAKNETYIIRV